MLAHTTVTRIGQGLPRRVWMLILARAINQLGAFSLPFLTVLLVTDFGAGVGTAGLISSGFGVAMIPSRLFGGRLADHIGRRRTIVVGLAGCAVAQFGIAMAPSLPVVVVFVILLGLAFEIYEPATQAMIAEAVDRTERVRAYNLLNAALAIAGMAAGLVAAGLGRWDLRWLFVADAVSCLGCAAFIRAALASDARSVAAQGVQPVPPRACPWRDRALLTMLVFGTVFALIYLEILMLLPLSLVHRGLRAADAGLLFTASAITIVAGQPLLRSRWTSGLAEPMALAIGYVILAAGLAGYAWARTLPEFLIATVGWSLGDLIMIGRAFAIVADLAPDGAIGRYMAVYGTGWGVAGVGAPIIGTQVLGHLGPGPLWIGLAGLSLALAAGQLMVVRPMLRGTGGAGREPSACTA